MTSHERLEDLRQNWKAPRELSRALPREVQLAACGMALAVVGALLLAGAAAAYLALHAAALRGAQREARLDQQGVNTEATITRLWRRSGKERRTMVTYQFQHDGHIYEGSAGVPQKAWRGLREGEPLAVRYMAGDPAENEPRDWRKSPIPEWLPMTLAAVFAAIGALLFYWIGRQKRLLSEGRTAPGIVTHYTCGQHGSKWAHYEFAVGRAVSKGAAGVSKGSPKVGDTVCVVYEAENPRHNARYPMELVKLR